ncbi:MAG: metal-sulfur cluster assembly factor [Phyllobacterium sp.]
MNDLARKHLEQAIRDALRIVVDPELGVSIVDLGMIYGIEITESGGVCVTMTTTVKGCPAAGFLRMAVKDCVEGVEGVTAAEASLTYEPVWTPDMAIAEVQGRFAAPTF